MQCDDEGVSPSQQSEPPLTSSHTADPSPQVIRLPRLALAGVVLLLFGVSFAAISWPAAFGWLFIVPIVVAIWVVRVRTVVNIDGISIRRFVGSDFVTWEHVRGIHFPDRRWARVVLEDKTEKSLPLVRFDALPQLAAASGGRITDPYAAAAADAERAQSLDIAASNESAEAPVATAGPDNDAARESDSATPPESDS